MKAPVMCGDTFTNLFGGSSRTETSGTVAVYCEGNMTNVRFSGGGDLGPRAPVVPPQKV